MRVQGRLQAQGIQLDFDDSARRLLAKEGYDPVFGARPLKRAIQREVLDRLSMDILDGKCGEGDRLVARSNHEGLEFRKKAS